MTASPRVQFFFEKKVALRDRTRLKAFIEKIFRREKRKLAALNYIFCSDQRLLDINRQFLKHDYFTDIITFDLSGGPAVEGEIYISVDRVKDNAGTLGVPFSTELRRVIIHGALHLCGFNDKNARDRSGMRAKEDEYLGLWDKFRLD